MRRYPRVLTQCVTLFMSGSSGGALLSGVERESSFYFKFEDLSQWILGVTHFVQTGCIRFEGISNWYPPTGISAAFIKTCQHIARIWLSCIYFAYPSQVGHTGYMLVYLYQVGHLVPGIPL